MAPAAPRLAVLQVQRDQRDAQQFWLALLDAVRQATGADSGAEPPAATPDFNVPAMADQVLSELAELALVRAMGDLAQGRLDEAAAHLAVAEAQAETAPPDRQRRARGPRPSRAQVTGQNGRGSAKRAITRTARSARTLYTICMSRRHDPVVAALALRHGQPPVSDLHVGEPQPEYLAAAQPGQQHRQYHRPVPVRAQRADQPVRLAGDKIRGSVRGTRTSGTVRDRIDPPCRRVSSPRGTCGVPELGHRP